MKIDKKMGDIGLVWTWTVGGFRLHGSEQWLRDDLKATSLRLRDQWRGKELRWDMDVVKVRRSVRMAGGDPEQDMPLPEKNLRSVLDGAPPPLEDQLATAQWLTSAEYLVWVLALDQEKIVGEWEVRRGVAGEEDDLGRSLKGVPVLADAQGPLASAYGELARAAVTAATCSVLCAILAPPENRDLGQKAAWALQKRVARFSRAMPQAPVCLEVQAA